MVVVIGDVTIREGSLEEATALSREHVERSRWDLGALRDA